MSLTTGIIGLPQSWRTTVFNELTGAQADTDNRSEDTSLHLCMAMVTEPRLKALVDILHQKRKARAPASYVNIGTSVKDLAMGSGARFLSQLGVADAMINVVRACPDDSIPHVPGSLEPDRDIADMNLEITFPDDTNLARRQKHGEESLKAAKPAQQRPALREQELVAHLTGCEGKAAPVRGVGPTREYRKAISGF